MSTHAKSRKGAGKSPAATHTKAVKHTKRNPAAHRPAAHDGEARRSMVAEAAYFQAEKRGFVPGSELDDWLEAEREIEQLFDN